MPRSAARAPPRSPRLHPKRRLSQWLVRHQLVMLCPGGKRAGGMLDNSLPDNGREGRETARVNLFMAATLHSSGVETAVKIRDLSATGAQIECSLLPAVGSSMTLTRGRLSVHGHVAWCTERRCGLHFSTRIAVADWMANPVNREQQRVDHVVALVKAGAAPLAPRASVPAPQVAAGVDDVGEDLRRVSRLLGSLGDALANDPAIVIRARHRAAKSRHRHADADRARRNDAGRRPPTAEHRPAQ